MADQQTNLRNTRRGKISLLTLVFLVFIVVLMGYLGNTGHVVQQKLQLQNASDSIAFSSSMWLARGMNTVTASNHLVGEAAAISVIHESLGGSELRLGLKKNTSENRQLDQLLQGLKLSAPIGRIPSPYVPPPLTQIDRRIIEFLVKRTSPPGNRPLDAFATLYDSRMSLKRELVGWMTAKSIANLGFLVPPPFGYATAIGAYAVHITASVNIVLIGKEWLLLEAMEKYATATVKLQDKIINEQLIPTLCDFSSKVSGVELDASRESEAGLAAEQAIDSVEILGKAHKVTGSLFPNEDLKLPLEYEPKPTMQGPQGALPKGWGEDKAVSLPEIDNTLRRMESKLDAAIDKINRRLSKLEDSSEQLQKIRDAVAERNADVEANNQSKYQEELVALDKTIASLDEQREKLDEQADEIIGQRTSLKEALGSITSGKSQNLSLDHVPDKMDPNQERVSQWVRSMYPNLDTLRAPILSLMDSQLPKSHAAEHYVKWTNRYALIHAWQFRSGQRLGKRGSSTATWRATTDPRSMLVMHGTFRQNQPHKGNETWTGSSPTSQREAEELFTVLATTHRDFESVFSPAVFPAPNQHGITSVAQAIVYNANPQESLTSEPETQPIVGWDTLNWNPTATANEWGASPSQDSPQWPWEIFASLKSNRLVKLNWQPKLVLVTKSRLQQAIEDSDPNTSDALQLAVEHAELLTH